MFPGRCSPVTMNDLLRRGSSRTVCPPPKDTPHAMARNFPLRWSKSSFLTSPNLKHSSRRWAMTRAAPVMAVIQVGSLSLATNATHILPCLSTITKDFLANASTGSSKRCGVKTTYSPFHGTCRYFIFLRSSNPNTFLRAFIRFPIHPPLATLRFLASQLASDLSKVACFLTVACLGT